MLELAIADWQAGLGYPEWSRRGKRSAEAYEWLFDPECRAAVTLADICAALNA